MEGSIGKYYTTPDGSTIVVTEDCGHGVVVGKIVDSPIKAQIGHGNVFMPSELAPSDYKPIK
jgi:hypothetical protein